MNKAIFLLENVNTVIDPSAGSGAAAAAGGAAAGAAAAGTPAASGGIMATLMANPVMLIIVYCLVIFGAMYFFSIKPQKKREKAFEEMRKKIVPGDTVLCNNGMFGKVVDTTAECFIIEFGINKGIRIPVLKQEIAGLKEPNLSNKAEEPQPEPEKKSLFGFGKKDDTSQKE